MEKSVRQTEKTQITNKTQTNNDYTLGVVYNTCMEVSGGYTKYKKSHKENIFPAASSHTVDCNSVLWDCRICTYG